MKKAEITFSKERIIISNRSTISQVLYTDIISFVCDFPYVKITISNEKDILISGSLWELMLQLPANFILCNRSSIVNLSHVDSLTTEKLKCSLCLKTGNTIIVSRRKVGEIRKRLKEMPQK
jgi:DNA-binding LytR/AlgR family response regulator